MARRLPFGDVGWHIIPKQQVAWIEKIFALVGRQGKNSRIHTDGIAWTRFDTQAAEDTAEFIDRERDGVFFYRRIRVLAGLNVNAQGWTRGGTEHTGSAARRAVFFAHQAVPPAIPLRDVRRLFGVPLRHDVALPEQVCDKMARCYRNAPHNLREIQFLPEGELLHMRSANLSLTSARASYVTRHPASPILA